VEQNTADALARSWVFLEQGIALDPSYAAPHVALENPFSGLPRNTPDANGVPMGMVVFHLTIGDVEGSIEWFEKAVDQREPMAVVYVGDPLTQRVRSNPRWAALIRSMNLEP
jgi:hypothetical protein